MVNQVHDELQDHDELDRGCPIAVQALLLLLAPRVHGP